MVTTLLPLFLDFKQCSYIICIVNSKTAIYVRVSTANGTQTTESQLHQIKQVCAARDWTDLEIYEDAMSGAKASRPQLDRMIKDMRNGKVERVVCYKLDRMGRSLSNLALIIDELNRRGISLICTSQGIDTSDNSPCGKFQLGVLMAVAEFEREIIKERVNSGLAAAKAKGVVLGRPVTLNKRRDEVLALREQGRGIREIARELEMPVSSVAKLIKQEKSHEI